MPGLPSPRLVLPESEALGEDRGLQRRRRCRVRNPPR